MEGLNFKDFGFYKVDFNYLQYLYNIDNEVYFNLNYLNSEKIFLGVLTNINNIDYFIPLTSAKSRHSTLSVSKKEYKLIYELVSINNIRENSIYKNHNLQNKKHILSMLDIRKMIPVPKTSYQKVDINNITDSKYKDLCLKEYNFCKNIFDDIEKSANIIYKNVKNGKIVKFAVNYNLCEKAMIEYEKNHSLDTVSNDIELEME